MQANIARHRIAALLRILLKLKGPVLAARGARMVRHKSVEEEFAREAHIARARETGRYSVLLASKLSNTRRLSCTR
jgi:hypothetical protein